MYSPNLIPHVIRETCRNITMKVNINELSQDNSDDELSTTKHYEVSNSRAHRNKLESQNTTKLPELPNGGLVGTVSVGDPCKKELESKVQKSKESGSKVTESNIQSNESESLSRRKCKELCSLQARESNIKNTDFQCARGKKKMLKSRKSCILRGEENNIKSKQSNVPRGKESDIKKTLECSVPQKNEADLKHEMPLSQIPSPRVFRAPGKTVKGGHSFVDWQNISSSGSGGHGSWNRRSSWQSESSDIPVSKEMSHDEPQQGSSHAPVVLQVPLCLFVCLSVVGLKTEDV